MAYTRGDGCITSRCSACDCGTGLRTDRYSPHAMQGEIAALLLQAIHYLDSASKPEAFPPLRRSRRCGRHCSEGSSPATHLWRVPIARSETCPVPVARRRLHFVFLAALDALQSDTCRGIGILLPVTLITGMAGFAAQKIYSILPFSACINWLVKTERALLNSRTQHKCCVDAELRMSYGTACPLPSCGERRSGVCTRCTSRRCCIARGEPLRGPSWMHAIP